MIKKLLTLLFLIFISLSIAPSSIYADLISDNGINFLKSKQDSTGRITTGFSAPSQWSAIALTIYGVDLSTVSNSGNTLLDFLLTDTPGSQASATDWENRILAIVAINQNPESFGGVNYVQGLERFSSNNQLGDTCSLNDDVFGLLALISIGDLADNQIKQATLDFLITNQDADGGFGFSARGCSWYSTSADMTAAAIIALQAAKDNNLSNPNLDNAIINAKNYLLVNQNSDGGFGYFGSSDPDTTGWVLMAFNVLGLENSSEAVSTKNWLIAQQSSQDGGFQAFDWGLNTVVSNSTTTAQALIALSGESWIVRIYNSSNASPTPTPNITSTPTPTPTPTSTPTPTQAPQPTSTPTPTPSPTLTPTPTPTRIPTPTLNPASQITPSPQPTPAPEVLGETTNSIKPTLIDGFKSASLPLLGVTGLFTMFRFLEGRRWKI